MIITIKLLQEQIRLFQNATKVEKLAKGYSLDEKYVVVQEGRKYLLRVGSSDSFEKKKIEFDILQKLKKNHVHSPQPIEIGMLKELNACYTIYSYLEGEDAKLAILFLSKQEQYNIGIDAGKELARLHLYQAPSRMDTWYERAMKKHDKYVEAYKKSGIKIDNEDKILAFIENNKSYLKNRPSTLQHDDFHLENIVVKDKQYVGMIDFNNCDWGDPLHDFVKVALFNRELSVPFSIGQIQGYFNHKIPENFWRLYSIYVAMVIFSSVVWSLRFAPKQLDEMIERVNNVLEDHKHFELFTPTWYQSKVVLNERM